MEQHDLELAKRNLVSLVCAVPLGRITTVEELARASGLPEARVQHVLSLLDRSERDIVPWHRVVPVSGNGNSIGRSEEQRRLLRFEGVETDIDTVRGLDTLLHEFASSQQPQD